MIDQKKMNFQLYFLSSLTILLFSACSTVSRKPSSQSCISSFQTNDDELLKDLKMISSSGVCIRSYRVKFNSGREDQYYLLNQLPTVKSELFTRNAYSRLYFLAPESKSHEQLQSLLKGTATNIAYCPDCSFRFAVIPDQDDPNNIVGQVRSTLGRPNLKYLLLIGFGPYRFTVDAGQFVRPDSAIAHESQHIIDFETGFGQKQMDSYLDIKIGLQELIDREEFKSYEGRSQDVQDILSALKLIKHIFRELNAMKVEYEYSISNGYSKSSESFVEYAMRHDYLNGMASLGKGLLPFGISQLNTLLSNKSRSDFFNKAKLVICEKSFDVFSKNTPILLSETLEVFAFCK